MLRGLLNRLTRRDPYTIESPRERIAHALNPLVCRVLGHVPQRRFRDVICARCRLVLLRRS